MSAQADRIVVQLGKPAGGTTEGAITGGDFSFDPDTIREVIKNY